MIAEQLQFTPYIMPLLIAMIIILIPAAFAWRRRAASGATTFIFLVVVMVEWLLGYVLELSSVALPAKVFWGKVQYLGIVATPVAWLAFAMQFSNREKWLTFRNFTLLSIIPVITVGLIWTTESHRLMWRTITLDQNGPLPALELSYGSWFWVHSAFSYLLLLLGSILLISMLRRSSHLYRLQSGLLLFFVLIPWIGNGLYISGLSPVPNLDLTPLAFALSGAAMGWNFIRFRLLDIVPVARRVIVDGMSDGVLVLDIQHRIVDINPAAQLIIGRDGVDIIGKSAKDALSNWPHLVERYRHIFEGQAELVLEQAEYGQRFFDMRISPLYARHGRLTGRLVVLRDITEQKEAEQELAEARDQALESSRLKGELLAKVSHELRTPLGAILGYAELLEMGMYGNTSPKQEEIAAKIINNAHYLTRMVDELLDQAQLDAGQLILNISDLSLQEIIDDMYTRMGVLAETKGLALTAEMADDMPVTIYGDRKRLQQILVNLVGNAIKFTEQGEVRVRLYNPTPTCWAIEVSDTGLGIPSEAQTRIFDPFNQVDGSITRKYRGSGLGLSLVKQLVLLMGGQVSVESEIGQGSRFTVQLPLDTGLE